MIADRLLDQFRESPAVRTRLDEVTWAVKHGTLPAAVAAESLLDTFLADPEA